MSEQPAKILRLFPRFVLESISALSVRTLDVFDPTGKSTTEILAAVKQGRLTRDDAISHMAERGAAVDLSRDTAPHELRQIEFAVKAIEATKKTLSSTSSSAEGALLHVMFKLSTAFCGKSATTVCLDCDGGGAMDEVSRLKRLVETENACALPGCTIVYERFVPALQRAMSRGYVKARGSSVRIDRLRK